MNWFEMLLPSKIRTSGANDKKNVPEGLWAKCDSCDAIIYRAELERNQEVCTKCDYHMRIGARRRLESFFDEDRTATKLRPGWKPRMSSGSKTTRGTVIA